MRWFVEISSVGLKPGPSTTVCVEAPQWQPALQKARAMRGDEGALSNFSIELLEDGFRAIDPASRLRYIIKRAPDDAALSNGTEAAGAAGEPFKKRPIAHTVGFTSEGEAVVNEPSAPPAGSAKVAPTPVQVDAAGAQKKLKQTMAFGSPGGASVFDTRAASLAAPTVGAPGHVAATIPSTTAAPVPSLASIPRPPALLPEYEVVSKREENPTERSPLHYREIVYAVAPGTLEADARRLLIDRFAQVCEDLEHARPGKLINLAVFDHVFKGRPLRRPMVTLSWKDWKNEAPEILYPLRDGTASTPPKAPSTPPPKAPSVPPASAVPSSASAPSGPTLPSARSATAPAPSAAAPVTVVAPAKAPSTPPAATGTPARAATAAPAATGTAAPAATAAPAVAAAPAPEASAAPAAKAARASDAPVPPTAPIPTKPAAGVSPSAPPPAPVAVVAARPKKRLSGDDLLSELFEAFGDLHFLSDALEGADFVLKLTLEKLPSEVGLVSLFDINKREFVVVQQAGGPRSALCQRQPERAHVAAMVMRKKHAVVISDPEEIARAADERWRAIGIELKSLACAPVELGGRYLGLIELANPLDGGSFNQGDGNALTYIGQQFAEFVASHGITLDPELIRARAEPAPKRGR